MTIVPKQSSRESRVEEQLRQAGQERPPERKNLSQDLRR